MDIKDAQKQVGEFTKERAWDIIMPSQRMVHLTREVGKLSEYLLFTEGVTTKSIEEKKLPKQVGDVFFSLLALANLLNIDIGEQLKEAMRQDAIKYPAEETRKAALKAYAEQTKPYFDKLSPK